MDNNMNNDNPTYTCGICGKIHNSIEDRVNCESTCLKQKKEAEKAAAIAKKNAEKEARYSEVTKALENAYELLGKYIKDYGSYAYDGDIKDLDLRTLDFFPSKLWHHFWL